MTRQSGFRVLLAVVVLAPLLIHTGAYAYIGIPRVGGLNQTSPVEDMVTSIWTNPAAIGQLRGYHLFADVTGTYFRANFERDGEDPITGDQWDDAGFATLMPVPFVGFTGDLGTDFFTLGTAVYAPFGRTTDWPEDGSQRYELTILNMMAVYCTPAFSLNIMDKLFVGAGFNLIYFNFESERSYDLATFFYDLGADLLGYKFPEGTVPYQSPEWEATINTTGSGINYGFNVGLLLKPLDWLDVGVSYTSHVNVSMQGEFWLEVPTEPFALFGLLELENGVQSLLTDVAGLEKVPSRIKGDSKIYLVLPQIINMGLEIRPHEKWEIDLGARWVDWSQYHDILVEFESKNSDLDVPKARVFFKSVPTWDFSVGFTWKLRNDMRLGMSGIYEQDSIPEKWASSANLNAQKIDGLIFYRWQVSEKVGWGLGVSHVQFFDKKVDETSVNEVGSPIGNYQVSVSRLGVNLELKW